MNCRKNIHKGVLLCSVMLLTACNDWLDVQPESQVEDTELFSSETGFKEALAGVYSSMVSESTYSKEMLFGTIGVLGQEWENYPAYYADMVEYDYSAASSEGLIAAIWRVSYNSIANVNNMLEHIDGAMNLFSFNNYNIIKGEGLALRAFLHFDLLRCFGVSYEVNSNMPSIPYSTSLTYRVFPQLSVRQVAESIEADLLEAERLLQVDPILTGEEITELDDNGYLMNRQVHMNYFAVKGLQARLYMWMHEYDKALQCAETVINSGAFAWADESGLEDNSDMSMATEQLFALNNINLSYIGETYFGVSEDTQSSYTFSISNTAWNDYYENEAGDYRYVYLFQNGIGEFVTNRYLKKFNVEESPEDAYYTNKMSLIRLSEMYLIKAECEYRNGAADAYQTLNDVRLARNVSTMYSNNPADFYGELIKEYRKEFIGEGQLFFLYKRLNRASVTGSGVDMIAVRAYTFPLPIAETDAAQRENNR